MSSLPPPGTTETIPPSQAKDPTLILIIGIIAGGIAYFLYGQWQKGIASVGGSIFLLVLGAFTCGIGWLLLLPLYIVSIVDAYMQNKALTQNMTIGHWTFFDKHL